MPYACRDHPEEMLPNPGRVCPRCRRIEVDRDREDRERRRQKVLTSERRKRT